MSERSSTRRVRILRRVFGALVLVSTALLVLMLRTLTYELPERRIDLSRAYRDTWTIDADDWYSPIGQPLCKPCPWEPRLALIFPDGWYRDESPLLAHVAVFVERRGSEPTQQFEAEILGAEWSSEAYPLGLSATSLGTIDLNAPEGEARLRVELVVNEPDAASPAAILALRSSHPDYDLGESVCQVFYSVLLLVGVVATGLVGFWLRSASRKLARGDGSSVHGD